MRRRSRAPSVRSNSDLRRCDCPSVIARGRLAALARLCLSKNESQSSNGPNMKIEALSSRKSRSNSNPNRKSATALPNPRFELEPQSQERDGATEPAVRTRTPIARARRRYRTRGSNSNPRRESTTSHWARRTEPAVRIPTRFAEPRASQGTRFEFQRPARSCSPRRATTFLSRRLLRPWDVLSRPCERYCGRNSGGLRGARLERERPSFSRTATGGHSQLTCNVKSFPGGDAASESGRT
jgi:hypothetical protein